MNAFVPLRMEEGRVAAPIGWRWHLLVDLARLESGHTPSRSRPDWWGGEIPWIALPDIRALDGRYALETLEHTNAEGIAHSAARVLPTGTVVLSRTASVGFVTIMGRPMATSQDFVNWVCGPDLDPEFLMHLFTRSRERFRSLSAGAVHKTVYFPTAMALRVCVPQVDEQRRIVARMREQLSEVARLQMSIASRIDSARVTAEALVEAAFRAQSPGVTLTAVGAVATIQTGYAFKSSWFRPNGVRLLRNANVLPDEVDWSDTARLDPTLEGSFPAYALAPGDIVLALDRPVIAAGLKVARLGERDTPSLLLQRVARLRPGPKIDADYLYAFMHTQRFRSAMSGHSQSLGVPHVSPRQVASVPIPLPPIDEQRRIAARLREQLAEIDRAKAALEGQRKAVEALPVALLREVFGDAAA